MGAGFTDFSTMQTEKVLLWAKATWSHAREQSFAERFMGGAESPFQKITELKKTVTGDRAVITLVYDLVGDGVAGDKTLKGREESLESADRFITIDQLRHANTNKGRMSDQRSVLDFRTESKDKLAYWHADRRDQLAMLTLCGRSYLYRCDGALRASTEFNTLAYAADVVAPSANRRARWNGATGQLEWGGAQNQVTAADTITWKMLVQAKAALKEKYIRGCRESGGEENFHVFVTPTTMMRLKMDPEYVANLRYAAARDKDNPLFTGTTVKVDGLYLHEHRYVCNTTKAAPGSKWGAVGTVDGAHVIICGAQALAYAEIGDPIWEEESDDYNNRQGIAVGRIMGFMKPQFRTLYEPGALEDFGVVNIFVAQ